jgi:hypothetical protein
MQCIIILVQQYWIAGIWLGFAASVHLHRQFGGTCSVSSVTAQLMGKTGRGR